MALRDQISEMPLGRQVLLAGTGLALVIALVFVIYLMFFRVQYDVLFADLRPADAAAIVTELETRDVPFKLANGETTILVPMDRVSETRIAIAGSDLPIRGAVGFELFNESDMGLTEFAQKINYQRALQGELARTIMSMDEIESARVHLAIPERAIFRGDKSVPKAAVTIHARVGKTVDGGSVDGIQKLVASAVNDLQLADVSVLDESGKLISQTSGADEYMAPELAEKRAVEQYYQARIDGALEDSAPGQNIRAEVRATSMAPGAFSEANAASNDETTDGEARASDEERNFRLFVRLILSAEPVGEEAERIRAAVKDVIGFSDGVGDRIVFSTAGGLVQDRADPVSRDANWNDAAPVTTVSDAAEGKTQGLLYWLALIGTAALVVFGLLFWLTRRKGELSNDEEASFLSRINARLATSGEA